MEECVETEVLMFKAESGEGGEEDAYVREVKSLGVPCLLVPVLGFQFEDPEPLRLRLSRPEDYSGLVLTSPRAVEAVARAGPLPAPWKERNTYAVGEATRDLALKDLGLLAEGSHTSNAAALALYIVEKHLEGEAEREPLLMPCGERGRREELGRALGAAGLRLHPLTAYRSAPHPALPDTLASLAARRPTAASRTATALVFFSPSGLDAALPHLTRLHFNVDSFQWIAIGPTTEAHMKRMGLTVSAVCGRPTPGDVREAVAGLLEGRRGGGGDEAAGT